jgi:hypothetical protein
MEQSRTRAILAANLTRMIEAADLSVRAWAMSKGLDVRMIDRLTKGEHAVTLDKLELIADACGLKPWHLLLEDLAPNEAPQPPMTEAERQLLARLRKLIETSPG